jgi:hypothetical protein
MKMKMKRMIGMDDFFCQMGINNKSKREREEKEQSS